MIRSFGAALSVLLLVSACGGATGPQVTSPMSARDTEIFDDAVDYVATPADLGSSWAPAAAAELNDRVVASDIVATVLVRAVRSDVDNTSHRTRRIALDVEALHVGSFHGPLNLAVSELEPGFDTVDNHESQLLEHRFVVFLKWARDDGHVVPRWHLAPASDPILADVRRAIRQHRTPTSGN